MLFDLWNNGLIIKFLMQIFLSGSYAVFCKDQLGFAGGSVWILVKFKFRCAMWRRTLLKSNRY